MTVFLVLLLALLTGIAVLAYRAGVRSGFTGRRELQDWRSRARSHEAQRNKAYQTLGSIQSEVYVSRATGTELDTMVIQDMLSTHRDSAPSGTEFMLK